jgi:small-conductance mechanosensitive channel
VRALSRGCRGDPRVLKEPAPACLLLGFGDSSVELELRIWIQDPKNGVRNVKSDVLLLVWASSTPMASKFRSRNADLHLKTPMEIRVATRSADAPQRSGPGHHEH